MGLKDLFKTANETIRVKSRTAVDNYDYIQFFKENRDKIDFVKCYLNSNKEYKIRVRYISPAGQKIYSKIIKITYSEIDYIQSHPELVMSKAELKEQKKLEKVQNKIIQSDETSSLITDYTETLIE